MSGQDLPERIRDYYEDPYHHGRCDSPTHFGELRNQQCGDIVAVELRVVDDAVVELWFEGTGCKISQGVASIFTEQFEGKPVSEIMAMTEDRALEIAGMAEPIGCVLLGFQTIRLALDQPVMDHDSNDPTFSGPDLGDEC